MESRHDSVATLARELAARHVGHPLRVGIDGVCGAGKTTLARALAENVAALGRPVVRLDSDGFHHPRMIRHRRTDDLARGYYEDAYDFAALRELVLAPLGPGGSRRYAVRVLDLETDAAVHEEATAPADAVVLFDATFLQRGALRDHWDEVVFLDVDPRVATARGVARDAARLGGVDAARAAYAERYDAACRLYLAEERPRERASIVLDVTDPAGPVRRPPRH